MSERQLEIAPPELAEYRWPAEWEPHAATWLSWPHNLESWPGKFEPVPEAFAAFVRAVARHEPVHVLAGGTAVMQQARQLVGGFSNVVLHDIPTNDAWARDHGPTFLQATVDDAPPALIDWQYNAWGGKYPPFEDDNAVPARVAEATGYCRFAVDLVLEGGAIEGNGKGTLLTTESCLLNPNRNPERSRAEIEQYVREYLGVSKILWLARGEMAGDDTDGHVDQLARFVNPTTVVAALSDDREDEDYEPLQANFRQLQSFTDQDGQPLTVVPLPMPRPKYFQGQRLPACYCNFYIANGLVAVPQFNDPADEQALEVLRHFFPDREVFALPALDLVLGLGAFHCLSQQQPLASVPTH